MTQPRVRAPFEGHPVIRWLFVVVLGLLAVLFIVIAASPPEGGAEQIRLISSIAASLMVLGGVALIWPWRFFVVFRMLGFCTFAGYLAYFIDAWLVQGNPIRFTGGEEEQAAGRALLGLFKIGGLGLVIAIFARTPSRPDPVSRAGQEEDA